MILTTASMLRAAERKLAAHRKTRAASQDEARSIAAGYRKSEAASLESAAAERRHDASRDALLSEWEAGVARLRAEAWERVAELPEGEAWRETERALVERVEFYRAALRREIGRAS